MPNTSRWERESDRREGSLNSCDLYYLILPKKLSSVHQSLMDKTPSTTAALRLLERYFIINLKPSVQQCYNRVVHITFNASYAVHLLTCVCNLVRPRIQRIWPALGFLSESTSKFSSPPMLMASVYSSGCPLPQLKVEQKKY